MSLMNRNKKRCTRTSGIELIIVIHGPAIRSENARPTVPSKFMRLAWQFEKVIDNNLSSRFPKAMIIDRRRMSANFKSVMSPEKTING